MDINNKILDFNGKTDANVVLVHHYFIREFNRIGESSITISFRELEKEIGISIQKIRTSIDKLEEVGIIETLKGGARTSNVYRYIAD